MLGLFVREPVRLVERSQGFLVARRTGFQKLYVVDDIEKPVMLYNASRCPHERYGSASLVQFKADCQTIPVVSYSKDIDIPVMKIRKRIEVIHGYRALVR